MFHTAEMIAMLLAPFTRAKIEQRLKHMAPSKELGRDGSPTLFYQQYWDVVGLHYFSLFGDFENLTSY